MPDSFKIHAALLALLALWVAEAWLEAVVIQLKDPALPNYESLNEKEHRRSAFFAAVALFPFLFLFAELGTYWLMPAALFSRRLVFDPALKLFRRRRLRTYEGSGPIDGFFSRLFGREGALYEITLEAAAFVALVALQLANL